MVSEIRSMACRKLRWATSVVEFAKKKGRSSMHRTEFARRLSKMAQDGAWHDSEYPCSSNEGAWLERAFRRHCDI